MRKVGYIVNEIKKQPSSPAIESNSLLACPMAQKLKDRLKYHFGQIDGTYQFPNSVEADLLKMTLKFLNGKTNHTKAG